VPQPHLSLVPRPHLCLVPRPHLCLVPRPHLCLVPRPHLCLVPRPHLCLVPQPPLCLVPRPPLSFGAPALPQFGAPAAAPAHAALPDGLLPPPHQPNAIASGPIDPNLALQLALSSLQWQQQQVAQRGTMFASSGQQLIQHGAGAAALMAQQLPGNDPRLASLQDMFPAVDLITVNAIFANKFGAENLRRPDASFLHRNSGRSAEEKVWALPLHKEMSDFGTQSMRLSPS
jgi:hypothetical protein